MFYSEVWEANSFKMMMHKLDWDALKIRNWEIGASIRFSFIQRMWEH